MKVQNAMLTVTNVRANQMLTPFVRQYAQTVQTQVQAIVVERTSLAEHNAAEAEGARR